MSKPGNVISEIQASATVLSALRGGEDFSELSKGEAARLRNLILSKRCSMQQLAEISAEITKLCLEEADMATVKGAIAEAPKTCSATHAGKADDKKQAWENLWHHLPERVWKSMDGGDCTEFFDHTMELGLAVPSEPTFRTMMLIVLAHQDGYEKTFSMQPSTKLTMMNSAKQMWHARKKQQMMPAPSVMVMALPRSWEELVGQSPDAAKAFAEVRPAPCPSNDMQLVALGNSSRCRGAKGHPGTAKPTTDLALPGAAPGGQDVMAALNEQMKGFGNMMVLSMRMLLDEVREGRRSSPLSIDLREEALQQASLGEEAKRRHLRLTMGTRKAVGDLQSGESSASLGEGHVGGGQGLEAGGGSRPLCDVGLGDASGVDDGARSGRIDGKPEPEEAQCVASGGKSALSVKDVAGFWEKQMMKRPAAAGKKAPGAKAVAPAKVPITMKRSASKSADAVYSGTKPFKYLKTDLPAGWKMWSVGDRPDKYFLAPDGTQFRTRKSADEYLQSK